MKLFDKISQDSTEEIEISEPAGTSRREESRLQEEVETELTSGKTAGTASSPQTADMGSSSPGSESSGGTASSSLPGMGSGVSSGSTSPGGSVDVEDVHEQNEEIISLLKDIKSELGGGSDRLL